MAKRRPKPGADIERLARLLNAARVAAYCRFSPAETAAHWHELRLPVRGMVEEVARQLLARGVTLPPE